VSVVVELVYFLHFALIVITVPVCVSIILLFLLAKAGFLKAPWLASPEGRRRALLTGVAMALSLVIAGEIVKWYEFSLFRDISSRNSSFMSLRAEFHGCTLNGSGYIRSFMTMLSQAEPAYGLLTQPQETIEVSFQGVEEIYEIGIGLGDECWLFLKRSPHGFRSGAALKHFKSHELVSWIKGNIYI